MIDIELDGIDYPYPEDGEYRGTWGENATEFAIAVGNAMENRVNKTGAETVGGVKTFQDGIITPTVTTTTSTPATSGVIRLAKTDLISWRDNANTANKELAIDASDRLKFGSTYLSHENWELSTPGSNTVLVATGSYKQMVNPSVDINLTLPSSGILGGDGYFIWNRSATKVMTLKSSDADTICTIIPKSWVKVVSLQTSPTDATHWVQRAGGGGWVDAGLVAGNFTGFGTVTSITSYCRRVGGNLESRIKWDPGVNTAVEARVALPFSLVSSSSIMTVEPIGIFLSSGIIAGDLRGSSSLIEPSVAYTTFSWSNGTNSSFAKLNGDDIGTGGSLYISYSVPISNWGLG